MNDFLQCQMASKAAIMFPSWLP